MIITSSRLVNSHAVEFALYPSIVTFSKRRDETYNNTSGFLFLQEGWSLTTGVSRSASVIYHNVFFCWLFSILVI